MASVTTAGLFCARAGELMSPLLKIPTGSMSTMVPLTQRISYECHYRRKVPELVRTRNTGKKVVWEEVGFSSEFLLCTFCYKC